MNFHAIGKILGLLLATFGASMVPSLAWSVWFRDGAVGAFAGSIAITCGGGAALYIWGRSRPQELFRKEATAVVGVGWILAAGCGALPYYLAGAPELGTFTRCYFESMSGLTTTGASVITNIEGLQPSLLFWRSWTHWLGGLGIIMLFVAILPYLGAGGRALMRSEVTGPVKEGLTPRIKDTALLLYRVYIGYTIAETVLLMAVGMNFFDALCHTFGTLATGGFSTQNTSIAAYDSVAIEGVLIFFMILAGTNFALMHTFFTGKSLKIWRDTEWRAYLGTIGVATVFVTVLLVRWGLYDGAGHALRDSLFTVVSLMTTTGYVTADFETWPAAVKCVLAFLMFVGGCAGSTGGGMKVMRWIILIKIARESLERIYRPRAVRKLKMGGSVLGEDLQRTILGFSLLWMLLIAGGTLAIATLEGGGIDFMTPFWAAIATLNNIGPGFGMIAATENYGFFSGGSLWVLSLLMVLGRLEVFSILVLFVPRFWRLN